MCLAMSDPNVGSKSAAAARHFCRSFGVLDAIRAVYAFGGGTARAVMVSGPSLLPSPLSASNASTRLGAAASRLVSGPMPIISAGWQ